ncbi:DUF4350 domain-containing protein [Polyangium sp. y55x31]|uniref:DUF4350 domain-containing protein n=1 Tax=Polyangium sp. y55x31 TaxID=3042688 RepID=UPI0024825191|nr:DUF4350 domain-containing protein [Polyangium sp. y55x31]MDI1477555.1 DUF4350 domain-containing protein [Polyangium sp. y55x31]
MIKFVVLLSVLGASPIYNADDRVREVLTDSRYRFCHEDDYPLGDDERAFCSLIDDESALCPSLPAACRKEPAPLEKGGPPAGISPSCKAGSRCLAGRSSGRDDRTAVRRFEGSAGSASGDGKPGAGEQGKGDGSGAEGNRSDPGTPGQDKPGGEQGQNGSGDASGPGKPAGQDGTGKPGDAPGQNPGGGEGKGQAEPKPAKPPPPPPPAPADPAIASAASGFARILFFLLLGGFIAFIAWMVLKNVLSERDAPKDEAPPEDLPENAPGERQKVPRGPVETDVARLLARARAAAQRGAFGPAIDDVYAALLRRLDGDGIIEIHASRTNGDYVRSLRRERPEIAAEVRNIVADVESVQFGSRAASAETFSRIHDRVVPLVSRALGILAVIVGLSATVSCGRVAALDESDGVFRGDTSPSGTHAVGAMLSAYGIELRHRRDPLDKLPDEDDATLVLLPDLDISAADFRRMQAWVEAGGDLVVAGVPDLPAWTGASLDAQNVTGGDAFVSSGYRHEFGEIVLAVPPGPSLSLTDAEPLLARSEGIYASFKQVGDGRVVVLADDKLFTNVALTAGDNAAFLISLFRPLHREVELCDAWTSLGADTPLDTLSRAHLLPILLQLLLLLGLFFLWQGRAFGVLRDPPANRRRAFADHVRALGLAYARAGASRHALGLYAAWAVERLRERVPREGRQGLSGLAEAIGVRVGKPTGEVMHVLVEATEAQKEAAPVSLRSGDASLRGRSRGTDRAQAASDFAVMRALDHFLAQTSRERSRKKTRKA